MCWAHAGRWSHTTATFGSFFFLFWGLCGCCEGFLCLYTQAIFSGLHVFAFLWILSKNGWFVNVLRRHIRHVNLCFLPMFSTPIEDKNEGVPENYYRRPRCCCRDSDFHLIRTDSDDYKPLHVTVRLALISIFYSAIHSNWLICFLSPTWGLCWCSKMSQYLRMFPW